MLPALSFKGAFSRTSSAQPVGATWNGCDHFSALVANLNTTHPALGARGGSRGKECQPHRRRLVNKYRMQSTSRAEMVMSRPSANYSPINPILRFVRSWAGLLCTGHI